MSSRISRLAPLRRTELSRPLDRIPPLTPRPGPSADVIAGPERWPGVLVLRPVTFFALPASTIAITTVEGAEPTSPASAVSVLVHTPDEVGEHISVASSFSDAPPWTVPFPSREDVGVRKMPEDAHATAQSLTDKLRELAV